MKFSTRAIHAGQKPESEFGAIIPPIYMTSTFVQKSPGEYNGFDYTRAGNPNFSNLEEALAALEGGAFATVFSSGLGAMTALNISFLSQGDHILAIDDLYGGTHRLYKQVFEQYGVGFTTIDLRDEALLRDKLALKPKMILIETPTNPLLKITDIEKITSIAREYGVISVVDNTFSSPYNQNPLALGADIVLHSATKYLGGHSDIIGGVLITDHEAWKERFDFARKAAGLNPSPFDTWLAHRGIKTLGVRMERHNANGKAFAELLAEHPKVSKVYYPGLPSHEGYEIARKQMSGFSGIVSVEFNLSYEEMVRCISSFQVFSLAESLGGVESLIDHPASMTHASIPREIREQIGLKDGLVRFSVGIEDFDDLRDDFLRALSLV